jgi:mutator protein MutT
MKITEVAAAVIERPDGLFLLAQRPAGKPYPGYWEFPGGKIESGEDVPTALARELKEELGIVVRESSPWITRVYAYTHATVRLHFWRVTRWDGEPQRLEDQDIKWQRVGSPDVSPMLPANAPVLAALALPTVMVVSDAARMGIDAWINARQIAEAGYIAWFAHERETARPIQAGSDVRQWRRGGVARAGAHENIVAVRADLHRIADRRIVRNRRLDDIVDITRAKQMQEHGRQTATG